MIPPFPALSVGDVFARSIATNIPFAAALLAAFAGAAYIMQWVPEETRHRVFLRTLAGQDDCPDHLLLMMMDARDPLETAQRILEGTTAPPTDRHAIRKALAAAL